MESFCHAYGFMIDFLPGMDTAIRTAEMALTCSGRKNCPGEISGAALLFTAWATVKGR
jgi:hypothetical protein